MATLFKMETGVKRERGYDPHVSQQTSTYVMIAENDYVIEFESRLRILLGLLRIPDRFCTSLGSLS